MTCSENNCKPWPPAPPPAEGALLERLLEGLTRPGAVIETVVAGRRFIGLRADGRVGLASTLGAQPGPEDRELLTRLPGQRLFRAAELLWGDRPYLVSLGLAGLNAGFDDPPPDLPGGDAGELLARLGSPGEVALVGDFPFAQEVSRRVKRLHVFELKDVAGRLPAPEWPDVLGRCRVAGLTATTILTRSLAYFLEAAPQAVKVLIGPSTPWTARLFDLGLDVLAGSIVTRPEAVLAAIQADLSFREIKRAGARPALWALEAGRLERATSA